MFTKRFFPAAVATVAAALFAAPAAACTDRPLNYGFYAFFAPLSYSADADPDAPGFNQHRGYEADLLSALEAMPGVGLAFKRKPIAAWDDIWLRPAGAGDDYDLVGGGITILESRTRDAAGRRAVAFTEGHIKFRQSLLVRAADAGRLARHADLRAESRIGALASTTGEARLLQLTGLADARGVLAAGARVDTPRGMVTADGSADYFITAAAESPALAGRRHLHPPPGARMPQVIYLGDTAGEAELLDALADGHIDAVARGEIGNRDAARASNGALAVTAVDAAAELGGFALAAEDADLRACLDAKIAHLTDNRRIGYAEWLADSTVFMRRARVWVEK